MVNLFRAQGGAEDVSVNIVKATLNVEEQRGDFKGRAL